MIGKLASIDGELNFIGSRCTPATGTRGGLICVDELGALAAGDDVELSSIAGRCAMAEVVKGAVPSICRDCVLTAGANSRLS